MIKLPIFIVMWLMMICIKLPTALLGFVMIPLLYPYRNDHYDSLPWWTRPWANPEDWEGHGNGNNSLPNWWVISRGNTFKNFYRYHAVRNPANGLRSYELLDLTIVPEKVRFIRSKNFYISGDRYDISAIRMLGQSTVWFIAWQGVQAGFEIIHIWNDERHLNIKFGWRIEPADATAEHSNIGLEDASFASKFLFYREG